MQFFKKNLKLICHEFCLLQEFEEDYADFKHKNLEFERRLGAIFCVAFLDCSGLESAFKVAT